MVGWLMSWRVAHGAWVELRVVECGRVLTTYYLLGRGVGGGVCVMSGGSWVVTRVPAIAIDEPITPRVEMGVLKATT